MCVQTHSYSERNVDFTVKYWHLFWGECLMLGYCDIYWTEINPVCYINNVGFSTVCHSCVSTSLSRQGHWWVKQPERERGRVTASACRPPLPAPVASLPTIAANSLWKMVTRYGCRGTTVSTTECIKGTTGSDQPQSIASLTDAGCFFQPCCAPSPHLVSTGLSLKLVNGFVIKMSDSKLEASLLSCRLFYT